MPKRTYVSEEAEQISNASSKRARTDDSEEEEQEASQTQTRPKRAMKKGKARAQASDDEDDEEEEEVEENTAETTQQTKQDDAAFEKQYGHKLRAHLDEKRQVQGGVAEHGVIEYVEMHQFMCHKFLKFNFGPQINFIIGHNGSGKSAVLSAITVALGGKSSSTGRGSGLKAFIREGQTQAEVTIHIKNQGDEAFKPQEYGDTISITRRFSREGSSTWKIKGKDRAKTVSAKKEELSAICDHMNIQVDNPMNVLTQDSARQFLSASSPGDKYQFFLRGTQLTQLQEEYDLCLENIGQTQKLLVVKKGALPDLKTRFREVNARYEEAAKAREQKKKADDLKKELAWSHVAAKEEEMQKQIEEAAKLQRRLPKIEDGLNEAKSVFEEASAEVEKYEAEYAELGDVNDLNEQKKHLQSQMKSKKDQLLNINTDIKQMNNGVAAINKQIEQLAKQIKEETRRMALHTQGKREEAQRKIDEAKAAYASSESRVEELISKRKTLEQERDDLYRNGQDLDRQQAPIREQILNCDKMIASAREREKDALVPYGRNMKAVLERIQGMRWAGDIPLGPLGTAVKAHDPETWGDILRNQLGGYLCAFAITDARDRTQLKKLLADTGNNHTTILIYEKDLFDYRQGEPNENCLTVLRALDISDPYVLRILINQAHIEGQILARTRREAEDTLRTLRGGGSAWSKDNFAVRVFSDGGVSVSPLNMRGMSGAQNLLLTGRNSAMDIEHFENEKRRYEKEYQALGQQVAAIKSRYMDAKQNLERTVKEESRLQSEAHRNKRKWTDLVQEANEDLPAGLAGLEGAKEEAEREKENHLAQAQDAFEQKRVLDEEQRGLLNQLNAIKNQLDAFEEKRRDKTKLIDKAVEERLNAQNRIKFYEKKYEDEKRKVGVADEAARILQEEFANWTQKAAEFCEQVHNPRKTAEVQRLLDSVLKALKEREKRHGASVEEMAREVNKAREALENAEKELKQMSTLNRALKASLLVRTSRWQEFRRHIALRCKHVFQYHLSQRGYYGKILFNHNAGTLQLRVQTDDQLQTQGPKDKDPRSLSGGEKSFSTICLLLSLWESIGCPLRCLDEFDVFMDAVNRRISMKMMIDTANTSDKKQYILITPQDMTNVTLGPSVRVLRMSDPERGNGTLPFGSAAS